mmetsp:Transcript_119808/g.383632  ORF Transcript_119808/g.383632 Transcript_119808/m.383632 type:complete len:141 (+) Transcript_119808:1039-1461(+)
MSVFLCCSMWKCPMDVMLRGFGWTAVCIWRLRCFGMKCPMRPTVAYTHGTLSTGSLWRYNASPQLELLTLILSALMVRVASEGPYLLLANQRSGLSTMYSWSLQGWMPSMNFSAQRAYDVAWHHVREAETYYFGIARFGD